MNPPPLPPTFTAQSTLKCPKCFLDIAVSTGGQANLDAHTDGTKCLATQRAAKLGPKPKKNVYGTIKNFFTPAAARAPAVPSTVTAPPLVKGRTIEAIEVPSDEGTGPSPLALIDPEQPWRRHSAAVEEPEEETPAPCEVAQTLVRTLRGKMLNIPDFAPLAGMENPLSIFSIDPTPAFTERRRNRDWHDYLEPLVRRTFGQGELNPEDFTGYIAMGKYGLEGFCRFFDTFIRERGLPGEYIKNCFELLIHSIDLRFPDISAASKRDTGKQIAPGQLHRALPTVREHFAPKIAEVIPCYGLHIQFADGHSHHVDYPFGLHQQFILPWDYYSKDERFYIQAKKCTRGLVPLGRACKTCEGLLLNDVLVGVMQRAAHGIHESTPLIYMPITSLISVVRRRVEQTRGLKLMKLNDTRKLLGLVAELDEHKQFVMAVGSGKVTRVAQLVKACLNNHVGIRGMLERYYRACQAVYNPKNFTDDDNMLMLLVLRLGGARLAGIVHRALGLPGLTTIRSNTIIRPLRASPKFPTVSEIEANIRAYAEAEPEYTGPPCIIHDVLMADEIANERRPRWDDKTNMILGACRECCENTTLELNTQADLEVFFKDIDSGKVHLASEATVAAFGVLSRNPREYTPRPCCISGTDKHENATEHAKLLGRIMTAHDNNNKRGNITYRTICMTSDGEARRGLALVIQAMNRPLPEESPIYPLLSPLELMNLRVGADDITPDKDYRHVLKTMRNLLMRLKGVKLLGVVVTPAMIKRHLRLEGYSQDQVNSYLNPDDKQDVFLGYSLLKSLWSLPVAGPDANPSFSVARNALRILGQLGYNLLAPYIYIDLTLHEQLVHLSTAAHLLFVLYADEKAGTSFMANQTYVNLMIMIKNVFFCVAKTKIDIPDGEFFIILLGTDRLEALFGLIRTAIGTDANVDILQLASRSSNLTEAAIILANRPQWDRSPRRLKLPMIINEAGEVSRNADHINPASWKGDVHVAQINLLTAWKQGRYKVEELLPHLAAILSEAFESGADIFSPIDGCSLIPCLDEEPPAEDFVVDPELISGSGDHSDSERDSNTASDFDEPVVATAGDIASAEFQDLPNASKDSSYTPDGDVEDALAIAEPAGTFSPHMIINGKKISKAKALAGMMRFRGIRSSTDRLKRVAGLPSFSPTMHSGLTTSDSALGVPSLRIENPVALVVSCEDQLFLAVAQVNNLILASNHVQSIALDQLLDSSAKVSVQILRLVRTSVEDDPTQKHDWRWSRKFEGLCTNIPGNLIHPLNPSVSIMKVGEPTYLFDSATLLTAAVTIHNQMSPRDFKSVPKVKRSDTYPYRHQGRVCFVIEKDGATRLEHSSEADDPNSCSYCKATIDGSNGQRVLEHIAGHLLFDPARQRHHQPCGLCGRPWPMCELFFKKARGTASARQVDWERSTCSKIDTHFNMQTASQSTEASPCSNHPVQCSLCDTTVPLVWTYNLEYHYSGEHNRASGPYTYKAADKTDVVYAISPNEVRLLRKKWDARFDKRKAPAKGKSKRAPFLYSEAHSTKMAFRNLSADGIDEGFESQESEPHPEPEASANATRPHNVQISMEDGECAEFGFEIPEAPDPTPVLFDGGNDASGPAFTPEYGDLPAVDAEVLPDANPPTSDQFLALATSVDSDILSPALSSPTQSPLTNIASGTVNFPVLGQSDWAPPLVEGKPTRSGRKRNIKHVAVGTCDVCEADVTDAERDDPSVIVRCARGDDCETEWYHRRCIKVKKLPEKWVCPSCVRKRHKN